MGSIPAGGFMTYSRFIMLSMGRAGSHAYISALQSHPEVVCYDEPFHPVDKRRIVGEWKDILHNKIWGTYPDKVKAVGFASTMKYKDKQDQEIPSHVDDVCDDVYGAKDVKFIFCHRQNVLEQYVSWRMSFLSGSWNSKQHIRQFLTLTIDASAFMNYAESAKAIYDVFLRRFAHHPTLELMYEDFMQYPLKMMQNIQEFIGVTPKSIVPQVVKLEHRPMRTVIKNYMELKSRLRGTQYEQYL